MYNSGQDTQCCTTTEWTKGVKMEESSWTVQHVSSGTLRKHCSCNVQARIKTFNIKYEGCGEDQPISIPVWSQKAYYLLEQKHLKRYGNCLDKSKKLLQYTLTCAECLPVPLNQSWKSYDITQKFIASPFYYIHNPSRHNPIKNVQQQHIGIYFYWNWFEADVYCSPKCRWKERCSSSIT